MTGLIDPTGNPISSGMTPGPTIRPGETSSQTTIRSYGQQPITSPRQQISQDRNQLQSSLSDLSKMTNDLEKVADSLSGILKNMESSLGKGNHELKDIVRNIRDIVTDTGDVEDIFRDLIKTNKELAKHGIFDSKKRGEALKSLEMMKKKWLELQDITSDIGSLNRIKKAVESIDKAVEQLGDNLDEALNSEEAEKLADALYEGAKGAERFTKNLKEMTSTKTGLQNLFTTIRNSGHFLANNRVFNTIDKHIKLQQQNEKLSRAILANRDVRERAIKKRGAEIGITSGADLLGKDISKLSGRTGLSGVLDRKLIQMASKNTEGFLAKMAVRGGGSVLSGIGTKAVGLAETGMSNLVGLGSKMAGPMAILDLIRQAYDVNVQQNKKVAELAGGGVFGGNDVGAAMMRLRTNLGQNSFGLTVGMGQTFDKNIDLMKSLIAGGRGVSAMAERPMDIGQLAQSGAGFYGSIFKNAIYGAGPIGLTQDQAVKISLDMMEKFNATTTRTTEFFKDIDRQTKAAGISTSKYLEIVEAVGSNFDNMNRSLNTTVTLLNTLGRSGRLTGDKMKEVAQGLTGSNVTGIPQRLALLQMMGKGGRARFAESLESEVRSAQEDTEHMIKQLPEAGKKIFEGLGDLSQETLSKYEDVLMRNKDKFDDQTYKQLSTRFNTLRSRYSTSGGVASAIRSGNLQNAVGIMESMGTSPATQMKYNLYSLRQAAISTGVNLSDLLSKDVTTRNKAMNFATPMLNRVFSGGDYEKILESFRTAGQEMSTEIINRTMKGGLDRNKGGISPELAAKLYNEVSKKVGLSQIKDTKLAASAFQEMVRSGKAGGKQLSDILPGLETTLDQLTDPLSELSEYSKQLVDNQKQIEIKKRTTESAEIFARTFEYLFMRVVNVLGKLINYLTPSGEKAKQQMETTLASSYGYTLQNAQLTSEAPPEAVDKLKKYSEEAQTGMLSEEHAKEAMDIINKYGDRNAKESLSRSAVSYIEARRAQGYPGGLDIMGAITDLSEYDPKKALSELYSIYGGDYNKPDVKVYAGQQQLKTIFDNAVKAGLYTSNKDSGGNVTYHINTKVMNADAVVQKTNIDDSTRESKETPGKS